MSRGKSTGFRRDLERQRKDVEEDRGLASERQEAFPDSRSGVSEVEQNFSMRIREVSNC